MTMHIFSFAFFAIIAAIFFVFNAIRRHIQGEISLRQAAIWVLLWVSGATFILFPIQTGDLALRLGIARGTDLILYGAIVLLSYLTFKLYVYTITIERQLTQIVRQIAIREPRLPK
jgi:small membrane protein